MFKGVLRSLAAKRMMPATPGLCLVAACLVHLSPLARAADVVPLLRVEGAQGELLANLQAHLRLPMEDCSVSTARLQRYLPALRSSAIAAMNALGYYHADMRLRFARQDDCWQLRLNLEAGEPVRYREVALAIGGGVAEQDLFIPLAGVAGIRPGAILHHGNYENLKDELGSLAADYGYFDARFSDAVISLDLPARAADATLNFEPGERYRFGELRINNSGILSDALIRDLLSLEPDEPYAASRLAEVRSALDDSQYFASIRISPLIGAAQDHKVPLELDLGLRPRHAWTGGIGFTTDTGPRARASYENRYVNSKGHRLITNTSISAILGQVAGSYSIPLNKPFADRVVFSTEYIVEINDVFESRRLQTGVSLPTINRWGWQQSLTLDFQRDDYEFASNEDISLLVLPGISLSKSRADDFINPSQGWKLLGSLKGSTASLLSDSTFLQFYGNAKYIHSFGALRLLARGELGATWIDETQKLPASLRYFAGGDQSVRGFGFRALGPMDDAEQIIGGKQLVVGSVEFDYEFRDKWRLAVFTDAGNAFDDRKNMDFKISAGIGIRWRSPIGPLRFDVARPFDSDEKFRIHITMGPDL
jgi:translocation and assembly module TamA